MADKPIDLPLRCKCEHVQGLAQVSPADGLRFTCYCGDCQGFAHFLNRPEMLDPAGGTDIFHMPAGRVTFTSGKDALRCVSFSGKVLRWYTDCCRTAIANTAASPFPVVGLIHPFMDCLSGGYTRDQVLGRPICRIHDRSAAGSLPQDAPPPLSARVFVARLSRLLGWWMRGLGKPNPFFDAHTRAPISAPQRVARWSSKK